MRRRWIAALVFAVSACARATETPVTVAESGSSVANGIIAVAARLETNETLGPIRLRVTFRDEAGDERNSTTDSLPYCTAAAECWWAASFPLDQFTGAEAIASADISVDGTPRRYPGRVRIDRFEVSKDASGRIVGTTPDDEGFVYLVARDGRVRGGVFATVTPPDGRRVSFAPATAELLGKTSAVQAYFYAARVLRGS